MPLDNIFFFFPVFDRNTCINVNVQFLMCNAWNTTFLFLHICMSHSRHVMQSHVYHTVIVQQQNETVHINRLQYLPYRKPSSIRHQIYSTSTNRTMDGEKAQHKTLKWLRNFRSQNFHKRIRVTSQSSSVASTVQHHKPANCLDLCTELCNLKPYMHVSNVVRARPIKSTP